MLQYHKFTGSYNPLDEQLGEDDQPLHGQEAHNALAILSMHHNICYRDNGSKEGKHKCDDVMLAALNELQLDKQ